MYRDLTRSAHRSVEIGENGPETPEALSDLSERASDLGYVGGGGRI